MRDTRALASAQQVSEHLGVPVQSLYAWRHRGVGPRAIRVGRHLRWRWEEIDRWLDEQTGNGGRGGATA
jgi:predicted DNA-binding transcriptional regulator AlpA